MPALSVPIAHGSAEAQLGRAYELLQGQIRLELAEKFDGNMARLGVVRLFDFAGSGTDVVRVRRATGFGWATAMAAMASETAPIVASAVSAAYDTLSIGRYGIAFEETFQHAILDGSGVTLDNMVATAESIQQSYWATVRGLVCTQGSGFSTNAATDTATLDVDDVINLRGLYFETDGFEGRVINVVKPRQYTSLQASKRSETALQAESARFDLDQGLRSSGGYVETFLGMDFFSFSDVVTSGGDDYGFSFAEGAIGWGMASTADMGDLSDAAPIFIPEYGIVITKQTTGSQAYKRRDANAWVGTTALSATVAPQFLLQSDDGI